MQKVVRRAALARNQAKRKARIAADKERHEDLKGAILEKTRYNRSVLDEAKNERLQRREDWMRGPLAPRRHAGERLGTFGTIPSQRIHPPTVPKEQRRKHFNIAEGDRVCILKGRDRGKIGRLVNINKETEHVTVKDLNTYDIEYPEFAVKNDNDQRPFRAMPMPIPIDDVRLVVPLDDPETGNVKDVLVKHLYASGPFLEREYGSETPKHTRYITGLDIEVPWPGMAPDEQRDEDVDTLRIDVEERTYMPSLQEAPFPLSVIDELRNKFSKYRQRHDPEWVEEQERKDYFKEFQESQKLHTPKTDYHERRLAEKEKEMESVKDENGNPKVSEETAKFIDQFMARRGQKNADA